MFFQLISNIEQHELLFQKNVITVNEGESLLQKVLEQPSISFAIIVTGSMSSDLPSSVDGVWDYSTGYSISRTNETKFIVSFDRYRGKIAIKFYDNLKWSDWHIK